MDRLSAIDSPHTLKLANCLIGFGAATTIGLVAYSPVYRLGHYRHLAGRVTWMGIAGGAFALAGVLIRNLRHLTPPETTIFTLIPDIDPRQLTPREIALKLEACQGEESAKVQALRGLLEKKQVLMIATLCVRKRPIQSYSWDPRELLGQRNWTQETEVVYPELLQKALVALLVDQKSSCWGVAIDIPTRVESSYLLSQCIPFIEKLASVPNLAEVTGSGCIETEEVAAVFSTLLDKCPKLYEIPIYPAKERLNAVLHVLEGVSSRWAAALREKVDQKKQHLFDEDQ